MIKAFANSLSERIKLGLPAWEAHKRMAPQTRQQLDFEESAFPGAKKGSVLLLFYPKNEKIHLVFIKRPSYDGVHGGQISFPGGRVEAQDKDSSETALRETQEEIGVDKQSITLFGTLSNIYIPPSNFYVFPYLGFTESRPDFIPDGIEVEYIIETPLQIFLDETIKSTIQITRNDISFNAPCYQIDKHQIWGATAIILSELEFLLRLEGVKIV